MKRFIRLCSVGFAMLISPAHGGELSERAVTLQQFQKAQKAVQQAQKILDETESDTTDWNLMSAVFYGDAQRLLRYLPEVKDDKQIMGLEKLADNISQLNMYKSLQADLLFQRFSSKDKAFVDQRSAALAKAVVVAQTIQAWFTCHRVYLALEASMKRGC